MKKIDILIGLVTLLSIAMAGMMKGYGEDRHALLFYSEQQRAASRIADEQEISALQRTVRLAPSNAAAHHRLGELYAKHTQWKQSAQAFKYAINAAPNRIEAYYQLGEVYMGGMGRTIDAIPVLQKAIRIDPNHADVRRLLGTAYLHPPRSC